MSFREQLQQVREVCLGAYAHQDVPFEMVVEELEPERDMSRSPLFQVMFVMQNAPQGELQLEGLKLEPLEAELKTAKFELTLTLVETEAGLGGWCEYNTDLFAETTITRMLDHWQILLAGAVADPEQSLSALPLLTETERQQMFAWNETRANYSPEQSIDMLFTQQAARTPAAVAVEHEGAQLSYAELNERANQLAHYLRRLGIGPEVRVGLSMQRSPEMVVGLLGILKAGGAYVPLDREYPPERLRFMIDDAQLRFVVTKGQEFVGDTGVQLIDVTTAEIDCESEADLESGVTADNLAYVIYTSGSTGIPKGVAITRRNASAFLHWATDFFSTEKLQAVLASTSINFDLSVFELFAPLTAGGRVILAENALQLPEIEAASQVELINTVPSAMAELVRQNAIPSSVRVINLAGEALSRKLVQDVYALGMVEQVVNLYGPSEDTTYSTYELVADAAGEPVLIGRPISNSQIYLLDGEMQPVAIGLPGELYIAGDGLARGYLDRAELTAERFVANPFARGAGERLYRTGDLARYREDGRIEYLGRLDHQVKIRGFRIELGEIETQLQRHPLVHECVVAANEAAAGGKRLVAYVAGAETITASELRHYLKDKLPDYMVPQWIVKLDQLPLTANGKVDRKALPAPERADEAVAGYVAPKTPEEELLAGIWAEVLELERVSVHDNFFERGGHSLLATQVMARVREVFKVEIPLRSLFENPTIAELSANLNAGLFTRKQDTHPLTRASRIDPLPLSFAQERLWFWEQLQPGTPTYNLTSAFRIDGDLDVATLEQSLNEIIGRHEILRTSFAAVEGQPVQIIAPHSLVPLNVTDLSDLPESEREPNVREIAREEALRPFDLTKAPLLRLKLLRLSTREHVALVSMHHIISDAWSLGVLVQEIATLYQEFSSDKTSSLSELPVQYADFAQWQREWLKGDLLTDQLAYWKEQLRDAPLLQLRTDRPRPQVYNSKGSIVPVNLPAELLRELKSLSRKHNVTLFMTLLAAFNVLLHRHTGQDDIVVGTDIANRTRVETEKLIGFFVNMLVLRTNLKGDPTFSELLQRVREMSLGAYAHQDVPFAKLVDEFHLRRDLTRNPLFQVVFVLQNAPVRDLELSGLTLTPIDLEVKSAPFDLVFVLSETADTLTGAVTYSTELFERKTVEQLIRHYQNVLEGVVADPDRVLSSLAILQDSEIDADSLANFEVQLSRKDLEGMLLELSQASHS
jgi:amino acid adenylation domain-containing protein